MNNQQKEVLLSQFNDEKTAIKNLKGIYKKALDDVNEKIAALTGRYEAENLQSIIYQLDYQKALKSQINGILDKLNGEQFETISDYLTKSYESGYLGVMYDLQGQGIPLIMPIDQDEVVRAIQSETKLSKSLYKTLGEDVDLLKKRISNNISRGIAQGSSYSDIARNIAAGMVGDYSNMKGGALGKATTIARTEAHRITQTAAFDAQKKAKEKGADVVKQWDSTLDKKTRPTHRELDGQIRELDEDFVIPSTGKKALHPAGFGIAKEDINCRCVMLQRARWALDDDELQTLKDRAKYFGLDKTDSFDKFQQKYLRAVEESETKDKYNELYPDELAGVKRGEAMTFDDADSGSVNPNYGKERGYSTNCQSCVVTFEARQRGYNVQVLANTKGSMCEKLSYDTNLAWIDPTTGEHAKYIFDKTKTFTAKTYKEYLETIIEQGNRYTIEFGWKGRSSSGHIVNLDRTDLGELRIKDNQRGLKEKSEWIGSEEVLSYLNRLKYSYSVYGTKFNDPPKVLRIDNVKFDENVVNQIMKGSD